MPGRPWWKFWEVDSGLSRRPHAPGVWLIYFTIATLPVFGLGQRLVPAVREAQRAWLFLYFLAYIASALGLLLATSFLNLRRYLRKRKVKMPAAMTATWLSTGAVIIAGLTVIAAVLPVPLSRLSAAPDSKHEQSNLRTSKYAVLKDSGVQGEGARSEGRAASKSSGKNRSSGKAQGSGKTNDPNAQQQTNGQGKQGGAGGPGRSKSGSPKGKPSASSGGQQGKKGAADDKAGDQGKGQQQSGEAEKNQDQAKGQDGESKDQAEGKDEAQSGEQKNSDENNEKSEQNKDSEQSSGSQSTPPSPPFSLPPMDWLHTPLMVIGIAILIFGLFRYHRELIQIVMALIAAILAVFGFGWHAEPKKVEAAPVEEPKPPPRPFSSYPNPFTSGLDHQFTPDGLVVYSFEALEAWAYEQEIPRAPYETPTEFVNRVGETYVQLGNDGQRLVSCFVALIYGQRGFRSDVLPSLREFWQTLDESGRRMVAS